MNIDALEETDISDRVMRALNTAQRKKKKAEEEERGGGGGGGAAAAAEASDSDSDSDDLFLDIFGEGDKNKKSIFNTKPGNPI